MLYPEYKWVDTAFGHVTRRNNLRLVHQAKPPDGVPDCYKTAYRYPDVMREHHAKANSVTDYDGPLYADWLYLDFDNEQHPEKALDNARRFLNQIAVRYDLPLEQVRCFYSGAKGFHVLLPQVMFGWEPSGELNGRLLQAAVILADGIEFDKGIYDKVRLFRLSNTKNSKTGLFKIPLYAADLLFTDIDSIRELAKETRKGVEWEEAERNPALADMWRSVLAQPLGQRRQVAAMTGVLDRWAKPCIANMLQGVQVGGRQTVAFRLAVHFRKQGLPAAMILAALRDWNTLNTEALDDSELVHAVEQGVSGQYDFGCNDGVTQEYCKGQCPFKKQDKPAAVEPSGGMKVLDYQEGQRLYEEYVAQLRTAKVTLGIEKLDNKMRGIAPGEVVWVIARAGVGKTALLLNILRKNSEAGVSSLFATLEMPAAQVYERAVQMAVGVTGRDVEQTFLDTVLARESGRTLPLEYKQWTDKTWQSFQRVALVDKDCMGIDDMEEAVSAYERRYGVKPRILAIDYLGRMDGGFGNEYEQVSRLAKQTKSLAKKLSLAVMVLHQVSRAGGDGSEPITMDMARGSGQVEEAADYLIGMWRPDLKAAVRNDEELVRAALLKCRKGPIGFTDFRFNKAHMTFVEA